MPKPGKPRGPLRRDTVIIVTRKRLLTVALSDLLSPLDLDDHVAQFVLGDPRDPLVHERPEYLEVLQAQQ